MKNMIHKIRFFVLYFFILGCVLIPVSSVDSVHGGITKPLSVQEPPYPLKGSHIAPDNRTISLNTAEAWGIYCYDLTSKDTISWELIIHEEDLFFDLIIYRQVRENWVLWDIQEFKGYPEIPRQGTTYVKFEGTHLVMIQNPQYETINLTYNIYIIHESIPGFELVSVLFAVPFLLWVKRRLKRVKFL